MNNRVWPLSQSGSSTSAGSESGSGSDSENSTDSIKTECSAACVVIQFKVTEAVLEGRAATTAKPNPNPNTTVFQDPPAILLTNFSERWNRGVDNAGLVHTIDFPQVITATRAAAYKAGLMLESMNDHSPKALPTSDFQELYSEWELAGYYAGT